MYGRCDLPHTGKVSYPLLCTELKWSTHIYRGGESRLAIYCNTMWREYELDNSLVSDGEEHDSLYSISTLPIDNRRNLPVFHIKEGVVHVGSYQNHLVWESDRCGYVIACHSQCNGVWREHATGQMPYFKSGGKYRKKECALST